MPSFLDGLAKRLFPSSSPSSPEQGEEEPPPAASRSPRTRQPTLPTIPEDGPGELVAEAAAATRQPPSTYAPPMSPPLAPPNSQMQGTSHTPVAPSMFQTPPAPSVSPHQQREAEESPVTAAVRELDQERAAKEAASRKLQPQARVAEAAAKTHPPPSTCAPPPPPALAQPDIQMHETSHTPVALPMDQTSPGPSVSPRQHQEAAASAASMELEQERAASLEAEATSRQVHLQAWAAWPQPQPQQLRLYTVEVMPAGYQTKWEELNHESQGLLLQIEDKMMEFKHESDLLDQHSRLCSPSVSNRSFELDARQVSQEIGSTSTIMDREMACILSLEATVKEMLWNTDSAIRSFIKLKPLFIHRYSGMADADSANRAGSSGASTDFNQPSETVPTYHFYRGAARRPSPFMQHAVAKFENHLEECRRMVVQLEQLIQINNENNCSNSLESLSKVVHNVYDYFIHVASKVENLHQYAETMRNQYLNDRWHRDDWSDPFLVADRREVAKQKAAARIVHPAGVDLSMVAGQPWQSPFPSIATSSSTRTRAAPRSNIRTSPSTLPSSFSSFGSLQRPTPFGSSSTLSLGSTPARSASSASFSAFGGTSLFRTPYRAFAIVVPIRSVADNEDAPQKVWRSDYGCCDHARVVIKFVDLDLGRGRCEEATPRQPLKLVEVCSRSLSTCLRNGTDSGHTAQLPAWCDSGRSFVLLFLMLGWSNFCTFPLPFGVFWIDLYSVVTFGILYCTW